MNDHEEGIVQENTDAQAMTECDESNVLTVEYDLQDEANSVLRIGQNSAGCGWCAHNKIL